MWYQNGALALEKCFTELLELQYGVNTKGCDTSPYNW